MRISEISKHVTYRNALYFFSLVAGWPCVFYLMGWLPDYITNYLILLPLIGLYAIKNNATVLPGPIKNLLFMQVIAWLFYTLIFGDSSYITRIYCLVLTFFVLGLQFRFKQLEFIKLYNFWLVAQAVMGGIGFLLVSFNLLHPLFEFTEMDGRPGVFYGLFTTNVFGGGLCRNAGFFDEPGALATWGMYALLFNKLFVGNQKIEKLLLFGLISTLSIAYFIQVPLYLFFFYKEKRRQILIPALVFFIALKGLSMINEEYDKAIFGRLQYDTETGTIQGDNRSNQTERALSVFYTSPIIGVGAKNLQDISNNVGFMGANIFGSWASDGILGQLIIYSPLLYLLVLGRRKKKYTYAALILILGFYQRPYGCVYVLNPLINFTLIMYAYLDVYAPEELRQKDGTLYQYNG